MSLLLRRRMLLSVETEINLLEGFADQHIVTNNNYYKDHYPNIVLEPNTTYTFSFDYEFITVEANGYSVRTDLFYAKSNGLGKTILHGTAFPNYEKGNIVISFATKAELGDTNYLVFRIPSADVKQTIEMYARNFKLVKE